jgi:hypothetical protein
MNTALIGIWKTLLIVGALIFFPMVVFVGVRALKDIIEMSREMRKK